MRGGGVRVESQVPVRLQQQLCFTVYATAREMQKLYRPLLDELGITYPQYLALLILWDVKSCTVKQLGEWMYLDSGTLTPMLKRMEEADLVKRERTSADERVVMVRLTPKGADLEKKAACIPETLQQSLQTENQDYADLLCSLQDLLQLLHQQNRRNK
ncbi:MarR family winged helix-turn-helix transcriptional regulator [Mechercharimyces sp. CAU 1602]|uniref:MarR family winged helix-turn-helix transcriptional regulator n=1 Tax=Mechercharimyces sp. CAU 1602 TaxID=2973933 RepID=UPI002162ED1D|nr:MarR family transcriptional regulator [Mechercharimyces sp. CAU 1602]MCS1351047.1 MarR family transcriptional regulator [Mechercharimyces sp. CAU 1602]